MSALPPFLMPSVLSTAAFLVVVGAVCCAWIWALRRAWPARKGQATAIGVLALTVVLSVTALLAATGVLARTAGTFRVVAYLAICNGLAVGLALSAVGKRFSEAIPLVALVAVHSFRLPLELVLHAWHEQGALPIQMTYSGENWDILTGIAALVIAVILPRVDSRTQWRLGAGFTALGLALLVRVMSIATQSLPWPLRTYLNDPPVLLPFHAPYTWILPVCVSGALFAHVVSIRWLLSHRLAHQARVAGR